MVASGWAPLLGAAAWTRTFIVALTGFGSRLDTPFARAGAVAGAPQTVGEGREQLRRRTELPEQEDEQSPSYELGSFVRAVMPPKHPDSL